MQGLPPANPVLNASVRVVEVGEGQVFIVASPRNDNNLISVADIYDQVADVLRDLKMEIVHERIFGDLDIKAEVMVARRFTLDKWHIPCEGPVTYVEGRSPWGHGLSGLIIRAVACSGPNDRIWTIYEGNLARGRGWTRNQSGFVVLQDIQVRGDRSHTAGKPAVYAEQLIDTAAALLHEQGLCYTDVVRTWFYLSDILDWYSDFNRIRNETYGRFGMMPKPGDDHLLLPASTGIGGKNAAGNPVTMDLIAVYSPDHSRPAVRQLTNSGQKNAFSYGSAFSRGAAIRDQGTSFIEVSGTAAIDQKGVSLYPGDVHSQIQCTLDKMESLIAQEGADLRDICAATVFVKRPEYAPVFRALITEMGLEEIPVVCVVADICRDELLFEMDAEVKCRPEHRSACDD